MTLIPVSINFWAVLICILLSMAGGALWYSRLLFGNQWMKLIGKKDDDISKAEAAKAMRFAFIPAIVNNVLLALMLGLVDASTVLDALIIGTIISIGFIFMSAVNLVLFEGRSFKLAALNTGFAFVSLNLAAIILTLWP